MAVSQRPMSLAQFLALAEKEPPLEFEDGVVTQKVSPKGRHSALQAELIELFNRHGRPRKFARAFPELRTTFGGRSYVPDVAVYRWERIPLDSSGRIADDFRVAPDVAVEIVSPKQSTTKIVRRCVWYVNHGVRVALQVDPFDESVLVFRASQTPLALRGPDRIDLDDVLPGLVVTVADLIGALAGS
jgi:Uma2 family endonuclease